MSSVRAETLRSACASCPPPVLPRQVEVGQGPRGVQIGVGVEALHEGVGLMAQVAFDLEFRLGEDITDVVGELQPPAELAFDRRGRQVRDVPDHARHAHARRRRASRSVVVAALPVGIGGDGAAGDGIPGDALRVKRVGARDGDDRVHLIGVPHGPLERLHPAQRPSGHRVQPCDPQLVEERPLCPHHVRDGDDRKVRPVGTPRGRVRGRGSRGAATAAEQVGTHHEEAVGVERLARTDHPVPPAEAAALAAVALFGAEAVSGGRRCRSGREAGRVRVAAQGVAYEDDVVAARPERPVGFVRDSNPMELLPAIEGQWCGQVEIPRLDRTDGARGGFRSRPIHREAIISG